MAAPQASAVRQRSPSPDDALEFFADSLEALYDHHVPAHGDPLQLYTYTPPASTGIESITVRLPPQAVNSLFAHHVWNAALRMADALTERRLVVEGGGVLELGAGAGIPGLVAARMGAERVVLSDYDDPGIILNLRTNIPLAFPNSPAIRSRVSAQGHTWGDSASLSTLLHPSPTSSAQPFTHILLADTLWYSEGHDLLLSSLSSLLARNRDARVHICAGFHSGRRTVRSFLRKAAQSGFVPRGPWVEVGVDGGRRQWGWDVPTSAERHAAAEDEVEEWDEREDASERNKWVVEGALGWSDEVLRPSAADVDAQAWPEAETSLGAAADTQ
ncbi:uncharacterized protein JCM10292_003446 [Rhodotorula paludigena]|uniref:uncharacterized protein n=1 Tax=Rhodotorula paludigena TaxID=86838 RepID=UPI0031705E16